MRCCGSAARLSSWPAATVMVPHMPAWGLAVLGLGLAWAGLWRTRVRLAGWALVALGLASPAFERPPDLLLSADGRMVGLRAEDGMFVQTAGSAARFTLESWQVLWRARLVQPLGCGLAPCDLRARPGGPAALLVRGDPPATRLRGRGGGVAGAGAPARAVRCRWWTGSRSGARARMRSGWQPDGARVLSDRADRGERIWMPRPTPRNRLPPGLVPALAEP